MVRSWQSLSPSLERLPSESVVDEAISRFYLICQAVALRRSPFRHGNLDADMLIFILSRATYAVLSVSPPP